MGNDAGVTGAPVRRPGSPRDRVMLAFDRQDLAAARPLLERLGVDFLTVHAAGPSGAAALRLARLAVAAGIPGLVCSPLAALRAGSDYVVVGRPVLADPDPEGALERLVAELAGAGA